MSVPGVPAGGVFLPDLDRYISGSGEVIHNIHPESACEGRACVIHNPSEHSMRHFPTHFRSGLLDIKPPHMERICPHGIGHPDPDDVAFWASQGENVGVHGCDGCCRPEPASWSEETCPHCKGYPDYDYCTCPQRAIDKREERRARRSNGDALSNRAAEPGSAEYAYLHRYDSPDNQRDSMG